MNTGYLTLIFGIALSISGLSFLVYHKFKAPIIEHVDTVDSKVTNFSPEEDFFHRLSERIIYELKLWGIGLGLITIGTILILI